ncbi:MAG: hypothetical protein QM773_17920 [Hyphomonadaceae bacterium]
MVETTCSTHIVGDAGLAVTRTTLAGSIGETAEWLQWLAAQMQFCSSHPPLSCCPAPEASSPQMTPHPCAAQAEASITGAKANSMAKKAMTAPSLPILLRNLRIMRAPYHHKS